MLSVLFTPWPPKHLRLSSLSPRAVSLPCSRLFFLDQGLPLVVTRHQGELANG